ncbi:VC0807 family protein [Streptomyces sp. MP131-18]|uniref:VC0807 family protein n=1 Tax=Streptomyces sp. MP131-18 TaxID=1857892 RepID=UPI00097CA4B6|nr:VC0807 family protein [Streptomyces sp. MP131-18]
MSMLINAVAPIALFYGLRAAGVDQWTALMLGLVAPAVAVVHSVITKRRIDMLAGLIVTVLLLSVALSFLSGSPRTLLARDGWITAVAGIWILLTIPRIPYYLYALRTFTGATLRERINAAWRDTPAFRRVMHAGTVIWGSALLLDAVSTVILAYTMPVDSVPLIGALKLVTLIILAEVISQVIFRRKGVPLLPAEPAEPAEPADANSGQDGR